MSDDDQLSPVRYVDGAERAKFHQLMSRIRNDYESTIKQKDKELHDLKLNFSFLKDEVEQTQLKLKNEKQIKYAELTMPLGLPSKIPTPKQVDYDNQVTLLKKRINQYQLESKALQDENQLLHEKLEKNNAKLQATIDDHRHQLDELKRQSQQYHDENTAKEKLIEEITRLNGEVSGLKTKNAEANQRHCSVEVLETKLAKYATELQRLEAIESKAEELEMENMKLSAALTLAQNHATPVGVDLEKVTLQEKFDEMAIQLKGEVDRCHDLKDQGQQLADRLEKSNGLLVEMERQRDDARREVSLMKTEVEYLRRHKNDQSTTDLETQLEQLKQELEAAKTKTSPAPLSVSPRKRPHMESEVYHQLRQQNVSYDVELKKMSLENQQLHDKISSLVAIIDKQEKVRSLQLQANPLANDQFIKKETLAVLREENSRLRQQNWAESEVLPRATFAALQHEHTLLQRKIEEVAKRNLRLKEQYQRMSNKLTAALVRYFGFDFKFLEDPINPIELTLKLKLKSRFGHYDGYLVINIDSQELEVHGSSEFKQLCTEITEQWVDKNKKPALLLAALNMSLYKQSHS